MISSLTDILVEGVTTYQHLFYNYITRMAKIINDDWTEMEFNLEDYISKEELEKNYVPLEKYEKKKEQAKNAFANVDKAKQEALEKEAEAMSKKIREEVGFTTRHGFDEIPEEIKAVREQHPTLSWEQAYTLSGYQPTTSSSTNPWRENIQDEKKTEYTFDEVSNLAITNPKMYNEVAAKIEAGEIKMI